MSKSLKEIWEEINDKPIEYVLQRIADLEEKLALTEKALELACKELGKVEVFDKDFMECDSFYDYFKAKAKE